MNLKKTIILTGVSLLLLAGCEGTADPDSSGKIPSPRPTEVTLHDKFTENFSEPESDIFNCRYRTSRDDFRYFPGVPSLSERNTDIMMLCIDPADAAGEARGAEILSKDYTFYGSYSARIRVPDIRKVQPHTGVVAGFSAHNVDNGYGMGQIYFEWLIADPSTVYVGTRTGSETKPDESGIAVRMTEKMKGFDASSGFHTYGFDWRPDSITWWILNPENDGKTVLWKFEGGKVSSGNLSGNGIPVIPGRYRMNYWHSKLRFPESIPAAVEAPGYPYELEIDQMSYEPHDDLIENWKKKNFN